MVRFFFVIALGLLTTVAHAETVPGRGAAVTAEVQADLVSAFMEQIHATAAVTGWRRMMLGPQQFQEAGSKETQEKLASAWTSAVTKAFVIETSVAGLRRNAEQALSVDDLKWSKGFATSALGRRALAIERASIEQANERTRDVATQMAEMQSTQKALHADPRRSRALKRLLVAEGGEEAALDIILGMQLGTAYGVMAAAPKGRPRPEAQELLALVEQNRPKLRQMMATTMLPSFAQIYAPLSTRDIEAYATVLETPAGKRVSAAIVKLMGTAMRDAAIAVGQEFARQMQSEAL